MNTTARIVLLNELLHDEDRAMEENRMSCPSPALLAELAEYGGESALREYLHSHMASCRACAELYGRLCAFSAANGQPEGMSDKHAWQAAQPKLQKAVDVLLQPEKPVPRLFHHFFSSSLFTRWALAACVVCLAAGVSLLVWVGLQAPSATKAEIAASSHVSAGSPPSAANEAGGPVMAGSQIATASNDAEGSGEIAGEADNELAHRSSTASSERHDNSFRLAAGTPVRVEIVTAEVEGSQECRITGRLVPLAGEAQLQFAQFSGVLVDGGTSASLTLSRVTAPGEEFDLDPVQDVHVRFDRAVESTRLQKGASISGHITEEGDPSSVGPP